MCVEVAEPCRQPHQVFDLRLYLGEPCAIRGSPWFSRSHLGQVQRLLDGVEHEIRNQDLFLHTAQEPCLELLLRDPQVIRADHRPPVSMPTAGVKAVRPRPEESATTDPAFEEAR